MLRELIQRGGVVMVPILLCTFGTLAVFLERAWALRRNAVVPPGLFTDVAQLVAQGRRDDACVVCRNGDSALARVLFAGLIVWPYGRERVRESLRDAADQEAGTLGRFVPVLATLAAVGVLLGLLGVVLAAADVLERATADPTLDPRALADAFTRALLPAGAGLAGAIPALLAHRLLQGRVDHQRRGLAHAAAQLAALADRQHEPAPQPDAARAAARARRRPTLDF